MKKNIERFKYNFKEVIIPELIYLEIIKGGSKGFSDVPVIINLIKNNKIVVKKVKDKNLIKKANQFNIQGGEAEVVALYWQEKVDLIASDDDNLRKKKNILNIKIIGTPPIILKLYKIGIINSYKLRQCISELRNIGWFSDAVLDKILMEIKNG